MNIDTFISWLIHSDWFLLTSWLILLGAAFGMTYAKSPVQADRPERREVPPAS